MFTRDAVLIVVALSLTNCGLLGDESVGVQGEFEGLFPVETRAAKTAVYDNLGPPDLRAMGDYPGEHWSYKEGPHATLEILLLDGHGTAHISLFAPFEKSTKHGLEIGGNKIQVREILGVPDTTGIKANWPEVGWYRSIRHADIYLTGNDLAVIITYDQDDRIQSFQQLVLRL